MIIRNYTLHPENELISIIRQTHLAGNKNVKPFQESTISIQKVSYLDLVPTQTFVLNEQLETIFDIRQQMHANGIDIFKMRGFLSYCTDDNSVYSFTPPIVEVIDNQPLIIDGMHRIIFAADNNISLNALIIEDVPRSVWPYQLPIADGWGGVRRFDKELPDGFVRKQRRYTSPEMNKFFFREYPFPGILKLARAHSGKSDAR